MFYKIKISKKTFLGLHKNAFIKKDKDWMYNRCGKLDSTKYAMSSFSMFIKLVDGCTFLYASREFHGLVVYRHNCAP